MDLIQAQLELARLESIKGEGSETNGSKAGKHAPWAPAYKFSNFNEKFNDLDYTAYFQVNIRIYIHGRKFNILIHKI